LTVVVQTEVSLAAPTSTEKLPEHGRTEELEWIVTEAI
jgi:hypothetical protein